MRSRKQRQSVPVARSILEDRFVSLGSIMLRNSSSSANFEQQLTMAQFMPEIRFRPRSIAGLHGLPSFNQERKNITRFLEEERTAYPAVQFRSRSAEAGRRLDDVLDELNEMSSSLQEGNRSHSRRNGSGPV